MHKHQDLRERKKEGHTDWQKDKHKHRKTNRQITGHIRRAGFLSAGEVCKATFWPTPVLKGKGEHLFILSRGGLIHIHGETWREEEMRKQEDKNKNNFSLVVWQPWQVTWSSLVSLTCQPSLWSALSPVCQNSGVHTCKKASINQKCINIWNAQIPDFNTYL